MDQLILPLVRPPEPSFDNFVVGRNAEAVQALRELASGSGAHRIVYLWGEPGCGRTHLLEATARAARDGTLQVVDGVETLDGEGQHDLFTRAVDVLSGVGHLLASGDLPPASLPMREDLRTRLAAGLVLRLIPLSDEEKDAALRLRARHLGLELGDEITGYMLRHCPRDMGSLFSMLDALDQASVRRQRPVTVSLLRECLQGKTH